jgi:hypothetical protein
MMFYLWTLVCNRWWQRAWVVQEIVLSPKSKLHYRPHSLPWSEFVRAVRRFQINSHTCCYQHYQGLFSEYTVVLNNFARRVDEIFGIQNWWKPGGLLLRDLLQRLRDREATLAVDKVYSVLGLQQDDILNLSPHYRLSHLELYRNVSVLDMGSSGTLHILENCSGELTFDVRSWVPDWTELLGLHKNTTTINNWYMRIVSTDARRLFRTAVY